MDRNIQVNIGLKLVLRLWILWRKSQQEVKSGVSEVGRKLCWMVVWKDLFKVGIWACMMSRVQASSSRKRKNDNKGWKNLGIFEEKEDNRASRGQYMRKREVKDRKSKTSSESSPSLASHLSCDLQFSYGFSSSHVLWELDHKEGWVSKNWCFCGAGEDSWESLGLQGDQTSWS